MTPGDRYRDQQGRLVEVLSCNGEVVHYQGVGLRASTSAEKFAEEFALAQPKEKP